MTLSRSKKSQVPPEFYTSCLYESPVGQITLAAGDDGLKGLWHEGQRYFGASLDAPMQEGANVHLEAACAWLDEYFDGGDPEISRLSLAPIGTEFRQLMLLRDDARTNFLSLRTVQTMLRNIITYSGSILGFVERKCGPKGR